MTELEKVPFDMKLSSANEGGADPYGLQIMCPRKAWASSALA